MPSSLTCPEDPELLAVAAGEEPSEGLRKHIAECPSCPERLDRFKFELAVLRQRPLEACLSPATASEPAPDPSAANGRSDDPDATAFRPAAASSDAHSPESETNLGFRRNPGGSGATDFPATIGKYLVAGRFPPSGQAEVFRVVHPQLHQERVLKLAKAPVGLDGRSGILEEGKILAELEHPHLIRVYDVDFLDDRPYLVMEYIRGRNLEQFAVQDQVNPRSAAELVAKVAGASAYAHRRGIVHRDINPRNILVDEAGEPRLIDFGMARLRTAWSDARKESDGGTFTFMAPEQARIESPDDRQKVGPRSDVFALGAVLYFLLTGRAPFPGRTWNEAWDRARRCDFDAGALNDPKVPAALRKICLKAMAAEPADRYASAEASQKALDRFVSGPKTRALAVGAAALALLAAMIFALWPPRPSAEGMRKENVVIPHSSPPLPLTGELTVRVRSKTDGGTRELKVGQANGLPLLAGEHVRLEARLNQPAYSYLLWVDGQGHASLVYPRADGKFGSRPSGGSARETVHSPEAIDEWHPMRGPSGMETALLLVRRKPLPPGTDLAGLVGRLPPAPLKTELVFATHGLDEGQPIETLRVGQRRGIGEDADKIEDPLLQLMERLSTQNQFDVIKAVQFAYRGE